MTRTCDRCRSAIAPLTSVHCCRRESTDTVLGLPQTEVFELFTRHRCKLLRYMEAHPQQRDVALEAVVRTVTCTGPRVLPPREAREALKPRCWGQKRGFRGLGRFVPDTASSSTELVQAGLQNEDNPARDSPRDSARDRAASGANRRPSLASNSTVELEEWLRNATATRSSDVEVNLQLGEFSLRTQALQPLQREVRSLADFAQIFGTSTTEPIQSVQISRTTQRRVLRLVGERVDLFVWGADQRSVPCRGQRAYPSGLHPRERWVQQVIEQTGIKQLNGLTLQLMGPDYADANIAVLGGKRIAMLSSMVGAAGAESPEMKEVVVVRDPPVVHVYDVIECGRRFFRSISFSSDVTYCMHTLSPRVPELRPGGKVCRVMGSAARTISPAESIVITRHLTQALGKQTLIPPRLLHGLLPTVLLETYDIWQNQDDSLSGYMKREALPGEEVSSGDSARTELRVRLHRGETKGDLFETNAVVHRIPLRDSDEYSVDLLDGTGGNGGESSSNGASGQDASKPVVTLLNLLLAPAGSALRRLARLLLRLEDLSHILVWSLSELSKANDDCTIDLIELPRLHLTFRAKVEAGSVRLYCEQHEGFFITNGRSDDVMRLLEGVPNSLLLEHQDGGLSVLVSAASLPKRVAAVDGETAESSGPDRLQPFPSELDLSCGDTRWLANLGAERHYLYPVHVSRAFLFCPSLAASLYMLLLRLLARQYEAVVAMAGQCVTNTEPTAEERQICMLLAQANNDRHPNAHACRLHIFLCALHTPLEALLREVWDLPRELIAYVKKAWHVGVSCRLEVVHELLLLQYVAPGDGAAASGASGSFQVPESARELLSCRRLLLESARSLDLSRIDLTQSTGGHFSVRMPCPPPVSGSQFDTVQDRSCVEVGIIGQLLSKLSTLKYSKPENTLVGLPAVQALDRWLTYGMDLHGGRAEKGFLFLYELMRGDVVLKLHANDSGHALGCMLIRMLPPADTQSKSFLMSILRVMMHNPHLARHLPRFEDDRKVKFSLMFGGQEVLTKLLERVTEVIKQHEAEGNLKWPPHSFSIFESDATLRLPHEAAAYLQHGGRAVTRLPPQMRCWLTLRGGIPSTKRAIRPSSFASEGEVAAFGRMPLQVNDLPGKVVTRTRTERGLQLLSPRLPFDLSKHPCLKSSLANEMLSRLHQDMQFFSERENSGKLPQLLGLCDGELGRAIGSPDGAAAVLRKVRALSEQLSTLQRADVAKLANLCADAVASANSLMIQQGAEPSSSEWELVGPQAHPTDEGPVPPAESEKRGAFTLARFCGMEARLRFEDLVRMLLSSDAAADMALLNPYASAGQIERALEVTSLALFTSNRIGQAQRCLVEAANLALLVQQIGSTNRRVSMSMEDMERAALSKANVLARNLTAKRHYTVSSAGGASEFDPRLLVFEFTHDLLLRDAQVELLNRFLDAQRRGNSLCHQLIMGQGKTTVIAPLLSIMLADGEQLVISVVPPHLLQSARAVMREKLAGAMQRPVYGMHFDRYTPVATSLLETLRHATNVRGVLLTEPSSMKSVMLKFVEGLVELTGEVGTTTTPQQQPDIVRRLQRLLGLRPRGVKPVRGARRQELRDGSATLSSVLGVFRKSVVLLDEVGALPISPRFQRDNPTICHACQSHFWPPIFVARRPTTCSHATYRRHRSSLIASDPRWTFCCIRSSQSSIGHRGSACQSILRLCAGNCPFIFSTALFTRHHACALPHGTRARRRRICCSSSRRSCRMDSSGARCRRYRTRCCSNVHSMT